MELFAGGNDSGRRLDRVLRKALKELPLPLIHRLIRQKKVFVNGTAAVAGTLIPAGAVISIPTLTGDPANSRNSYDTGNLMDMPPVLWQGQDILAVNKPSGLPVHGEGSLNEIVCSYLAGKLPHSLSFKPGPLHRIDKPATGIVVFSTGIEGAREFSRLMREGTMQKTYLVIAEGEIKNTQIWSETLVRDKALKMTFAAKGGLAGTHGEAAPCAHGKEAVTTVSPIACNGKYTLMAAEIKTGRTHQIRAQASAHRHPLAGDLKYGGHSLPANLFSRRQAEKYGNFFLHSWKMEIPFNPPVSIRAPIPEGFKKAIRLFFSLDESAI
jgi:23S rRNA pseudouridine955/2504/2580 synthase